MIYDDSHCDTYEEYCKEILAYMRCQNESFDFGEGEMEMSLGEYGMYKVAILHYLNKPYYENTEFGKRWKAQQVDKLHRQIEARYDELSIDRLQQKLHSRYDNNMKWRSKRTFIAKYKYYECWYYPYFTKFDENGNEYLVYSNYTNKKDKAWDKNRRKRDRERAIEEETNNDY